MGNNEYVGKLWKVRSYQIGQVCEAHTHVYCSSCINGNKWNYKINIFGVNKQTKLLVSPQKSNIFLSGEEINQTEWISEFGNCNSEELVIHIYRTWSSYVTKNQGRVRVEVNLGKELTEVRKMMNVNRGGFKVASAK